MEYFWKGWGNKWKWREMRRVPGANWRGQILWLNSCLSSLLVTFKKIKAFFILFERWRETETQRTFLWWFTSQLPIITRAGQTRPNLGVQNSVWVSHVHGRDCSLLLSMVGIGGNLDRKWRSPNLSQALRRCYTPQWYLNCCSQYVPPLVHWSNCFLGLDFH